jgi:hypothetical protein
MLLCRTLCENSNLSPSLDFSRSGHYTIFRWVAMKWRQAPMDRAGKVRWWQPAPKPKPSLRTHGILGVAVHIVGTAADMALIVGSTVIVGVALIRYFQGSCSILIPLPNCFNQVPFSDWILLLLFISITLDYIEKLIVARRKRQMDDTEFLR